MGKSHGEFYTKKDIKRAKKDILNFVLLFTAADAVKLYHTKNALWENAFKNAAILAGNLKDQDCYDSLIDAINWVAQSPTNENRFDRDTNEDTFDSEHLEETAKWAYELSVERPKKWIKAFNRAMSVYSV